MDQKGRSSGRFVRERVEAALWTVADAAAYLGVSRRTFYRLAAAGAAPKPVRIGGSSRVPADEVRATVEQLKRRRQR